MAPIPDFYEDRKFCRFCAQYVPYLSSLDRSYCTQCGGPVQLFSLEDRARFDVELRREMSTYRDLAEGE